MKYYEVLENIEKNIHSLDKMSFREIEPYLSVKGIREFFFKILVDSDDIFSWIIFLSRNGYFNPQNIPLPEEDPKDSTRFIQRQWIVLPSLNVNFSIIAAYVPKVNVHAFTISGSGVSNVGATITISVGIA